MNQLKKWTSFKSCRRWKKLNHISYSNMNSDLVKLKIKSDSVIDINIQNEIIKLKDRMDKLETLCNTRFNIIENSMNELLKTILQKL